jgi:hypothetical protein
MMMGMMGRLQKAWYAALNLSGHVFLYVAFVPCLPRKKDRVDQKHACENEPGYDAGHKEPSNRFNRQGPVEDKIEAWGDKDTEGASCGGKTAPMGGLIFANSLFRHSF